MKVILNEKNSKRNGLFNIKLTHYTPGNLFLNSNKYGINRMFQ
jgi:hypothetical protein